MDEQKLYQVALSLIPGVGNLLTKNLISYCGSAKAVFSAPKSKLSKIPGIGPKTAESIIQNRFLQQAEKELAAAEKHDAQILAYTDKEYPYRLKQVPDAPTILFYKGNSAPDSAKTVAIVGTRQATPYGKQLCEQIVAELLPYQPLIISGLAYGIDIIAHRAALRNGLPTLGVMASGLDIVYTLRRIRILRRKCLSRVGC
ncbi:DNA-processing protein DprA [Nafulsella turpanensis]|uniref:DNA-processing protein DprA n=1 Tax=Nafulsella turpanensis TaxID=1265690 RepID=UPI000347D399|nr:DNA-processing protein DprA [Nafulsella turpanensis]